MAASLREVAERAGLSSTTISRILNNQGTEARISKATQDRVRRIAQDIGFRPNRLAQGLSRGRSNIIGLMIPGLHNPFYLNLLELAEINALRAGYDVLADTAFQLRAKYEVESKLSGWPIDGVLTWMSPDQKVSDYLDTWSNELPTVYLGYQRDDGQPYVAVDREIGVRTLMEHLVSKGYRRIAYLYPWQNIQPVEQRYVVYCDMCAEIGIEPHQIFLELPDGPDETRLITQAGLREAGVATGLRIAGQHAHDRYDAIVCHNDLVAIGLYNGLRRSGMRVPEDMAVAGFDGIEEGACMDKPLTTVISPVAKIVDAGLDILTWQLGKRDGSAAPEQQVVFPSLLSIGGTT